MKFDGFVDNIPDQPLIETAPLARSLSRRLCPPGPDSCADYHGLRPYWRILNVVTSPSHHIFYTERFTQLISTGQINRILISGCADYDQLANVLHACRLAGAGGGEPAQE